MPPEEMEFSRKETEGQAWAVTLHNLSGNQELLPDNQDLSEDTHFSHIITKKKNHITRKSTLFTAGFHSDTLIYTIDATEL